MVAPISRKKLEINSRLMRKNKTGKARMFFFSKRYKPPIKVAAYISKENNTSISEKLL
jgi:hypothetical protein